MKNKNIDIATLILRVTLGTIFIAHGLLKVMVFTLPGTVQFFDSVGFPGWMAYVVTLAEISGGIALIAGIYVRQVAYAMIPILVGAFYVHSGNGWLFTNQNGGWEYPLFLLIVTYVQAQLGAGKYVLSWPQQQTSTTTA